MWREISTAKFMTPEKKSAVLKPMKKKETSRFLSKLVKLVRDEKGQIVIMFTIMVPVIMGVIGLSLEYGRVRLLNSQLQDLADGAALAGAKQLDRKAGAIARAQAAAQALQNPHWWSEIDLPVHIASFVFYSELKCVPTCAITPNDVPLDPNDPALDLVARYIRVLTNVGRIFPAFLVAVGAIEQKDTNATATAESTFVACNVQPLMLCNPNEPKCIHATAGDLYGFTATGNTGGYSPGDFNLLDPAGQTHSGAQETKKLLAATNLNFCYVDNVSPAQGQRTQDVADGINVRFDIPPRGNNTGVDTTPAPNVIKGQIPNIQCTNFIRIPTPSARDANRYLL